MGRGRAALAALVGLTVLASASHAALSHNLEVNVTVPPFKTEKEDSYVCVAAHLPPSPHKLVGVIPHARQEVVHHILLYGCDEPHMMPAPNGSAVAWRCDMKPTCNGPSTIVYGWGKNAPDLRLPEGVGFSVGDGTGIKYIVAQVHYLAIRPDSDRSGVTLLLKPHAVPYAAGLVSFASWFSIPPGKKSHQIKNSCCFKSHQPLTMFAVRVHTHTLGRRVYMTRETWNHSGTQELISRDPQLPQSFVPAPRHVLWAGDRVTVTCDFDSTSRTAVTNAGGTHNDEMCNMYVMVYGRTPYLTMCDDDRQDIRSDSPGALPGGATLALDPTPTWTPPPPTTPGGETPAGPIHDATGVATGPDGTVWVLYRGQGVWKDDTFDHHERITRTTPVPEATVWQLDPDNGTVLQRWGSDFFYLPHSITVDNLGNVWVVDVGMHQVHKFTKDGKLIFSVGTKLAPGNDKQHLCKPTKVSVKRDGSFFVADGYCNSRVVYYDKNGKFLAASAPVHPVVHSVLVDECEGLVYVASRESGKIFALSLEVESLLQIKATYDLGVYGMAWSLAFGPYGEQLALMWADGKDAQIVNVKFGTSSDQARWTLPGTAKGAPHDFVLGAAPTELSGAGDRFYAAYVASVGSVCGDKCGPVAKWVFVPQGMKLPSLLELTFLISPQKEVHPGDAQELKRGTVVETHIAKAGVPADVVKVKDGVVEKIGKDGETEEEDEGGAMVADDYDEDVEDDTVDAADYEQEKAAMHVYDEWEQEVEADYEEAATGIRPNFTRGPAVKPIAKERYEVLMQDKQSVRKTEGTNPWAIALVVVMAVMMAVTIIRFSKGAMTSYIQGIRGAPLPPQGGITGGPSASAGAAAGGSKVRWSDWAPAGLLSRFQRLPDAKPAAPAGTSAGAKRFNEEVAAARERERLLRSEPV
ncbi:hypothetical protein HYH03_003590 [Edaphochlamys debaryana]|uniref:Peptidylglycine monooxygenase n=1 Tax=Edaphochlamys debaryana TaxID=47281 RepID=A0A835Y8Q4_9CHLO|nr:hypothetical protein HYH03_003590 [Edaphochlamys debaryana]|eukprot:KAG2498330.1 hypothetical protein HYH03_003590 [Edaphochlamys debaryana]